MRLLLDTHIFLWALTKSTALSKEAWALLENPESELTVSVASIWEIAIKFSQRRGRGDDMPISGRDALLEVQNAQFNLLPISGIHAAAVDRLPSIHRDPFDRLLVVQAQYDGLTLMTHDKALGVYGGFVLIV